MQLSFQGDVPAAGEDILAEPLADTLNHIIDTINGNNIDKNNVDYSSADGIMVLDEPQTRTGQLTLTNTFTVGVNDTGHDVTFYGATSGKKMLWDESADKLQVDGTLQATGTFSEPIVIGSARLWHDTTNGFLRVKFGSNPLAIDDGTVIMEG